MQNQTRPASRSKNLIGKKVNPGDLAEGIILMAKETMPQIHIKEGVIILCIIPNRKEFVTWWADKDLNTFNGHYYLNLYAAIQDFKRRI